MASVVVGAWVDAVVVELAEVSGDVPAEGGLWLPRWMITNATALTAIAVNTIPYAILVDLVSVNADGWGWSGGS